MKFDSTDVEIERRADMVFDGLSDFEKFSLWRDGTAFTTYERLGDEVCAVLKRRARAWWCLQVTNGGFNARKPERAS